MARRVMRLLLAALLLLWAGQALAAPQQELPVKGMVTLVDLGAKTCIPCRMMAPILTELEKDYRGKAAVVFVDVGENSQAAGRFRIRVIPTQIFFDRTGKEVLRHEGFMDKKALAEQLNRLLAK